MKTALLLIALGFGYKVFADATKEQGALKTIGRAIGLVMIITSVGIGAYKIAKCANVSGLCPTKSSCGMSSAACPMMK